jgi:hypothetical protein
MEPTVRIGWSKPDFRQNHTPTPRQTQLTLSLQAQPILKPLTEGFTETKQAKNRSAEGQNKPFPTVVYQGDTLFSANMSFSPEPREGRKTK